MDYRLAGPSDLATLVAANERLLADEEHPKRYSEQQLRALWEAWLKEGFRAVLFEESGALVAYALYRLSDDGIYLKQFYVERDQRRSGAGREAFEYLRDEIWAPGIRVYVDSLWHNTAAIDFWREMGFREYSLTLELTDEAESQLSAKAG
jgi:GNAT superfamily N-acetyltransferase